jgi:hypothetical protein
MHSSVSLRLGVALALAGALACADAPVPTSSLAPAGAADARAAETRTAASTSDDNVEYSPLLAQINASLAASSATYRITSAELRIAGEGWTNNVTSTVLLASDRYRGIGAEWVKGDPRRDGRIGVTYAFGSNTAIAPVTRNPDGSNVRLVTPAEQAAYIDEAMSAWRDLQCSSKPITKVAVPAGTDPDIVDQLVRGQAPSQNYAQPADIVHSGWQPASWFRALAGGASGDNIIGVTLSFGFTDNAGNFTDIDRNGKADLAQSELFYNTRFAWGNGALNVVDFYSIITHESGHALGLGHFGKVFITKRDAADGLQIADVKYAPKALMNAVYVTGRDEIAGTDQSSFCQIWASF